MEDITRVELPNGDIHYIKDSYARSLLPYLERGLAGNETLPFHWKDGKGVVPYNISVLRTQWERPIAALVYNPWMTIGDYNNGDGIGIYHFHNTNSVSIAPGAIGVIEIGINVPWFNDGTVFFQNYGGWPGDRYYMEDADKTTFTRIKVAGQDNLIYLAPCKYWYADHFNKILAYNPQNYTVNVGIGDLDIDLSVTFDHIEYTDNNWKHHISENAVLFNMADEEYWNLFERDGSYIRVFFKNLGAYSSWGVELFKAPANDPNNWTSVGSISGDAKLTLSSGNDLYFYKIECRAYHSSMEYNQYKNYVFSYIGNVTITTN